LFNFFNREREVEFSIFTPEPWKLNVTLRCTSDSGKVEDITFASRNQLRSALSGVGGLEPDKLLFHGRNRLTVTKKDLRQVGFKVVP
jgi:hypothetical protein